MNTVRPSDFIASISYDIRLAPYDIQGSIAHAKMLAKCRIIPRREAQRIIRGLTAIQRDLARGKSLPIDEDVHYAVERELIRRVGSVGGKLHTARSRNDQIALDLRLYLRERIQSIQRELTRLERAIITFAERHFGTIMPGFTHLQHAQPLLLSHHLLAYAWMLQRDKTRLSDCARRMDELPLGSAALAGTSFPIDRAAVARDLRFSRLAENSVDAVSDRDFLVEFVSDGALIMMHLSRLAEEMVLWSSPEFLFIELGAEFTSGSSIMPQKRNPDVAEVLRAETGRVYGNLINLLVILKGLPLSYNRDLQEDKPALFDTVDTLQACLEVTAPMLLSLRVNAERMRRLCDRGYLSATELADYLTETGVPFREAHGIVKRIVAYCREHGLPLERLSLPELRRFHPRFDSGALAVLSPERVVERKRSPGGTASFRVREQIRHLKRLLQ
ncbi:MAG: argininosuccinate lyase [Elusimicrobia bacterium]|nr:argininosuccinate lyase [Elusimicrobiota bacterium]